MTKMTDTAAAAAIGAATRELRLPVIRADAGRIAEIAQRAQLSYLAFLAEVLSAEVDERDDAASARHRRRFPAQASAEFNLDDAPTVNPATIAALASGAYLDAGEPVVLLGDSGTGKSHLLIALGMAACEQGRRVRYVTRATGERTGGGGR